MRAVEGATVTIQGIESVFSPGYTTPKCWIAWELEILSLTNLALTTHAGCKRLCSQKLNLQTKFTNT